MKTGKLAVIVLLLSSCLLASGNVYIDNNSGSTVKVSVKESAGIPKQTVSMNGGSDHNFTVGAGKVGAFKFVHISTLTVATLVYVHTGIAKANLVDGRQVMLADQLGGPGVVGGGANGAHHNVGCVNLASLIHLLSIVQELNPWETSNNLTQRHLPILYLGRSCFHIKPFAELV